MIEYEQKYKEALERARKLKEDPQSVFYEYSLKEGDTICDYIFPELSESEDELTWLTKYIEEEAYSLSMDIRNNEDRIKLKKLQKTLSWLEKQKEPELSEDLGEYITELSKQFPEVSFAKLSRIAVRVKNWLEKQGEHSIYNVPSREVILAIWDLGNEWKELTNGCISAEHGTQLNYIQKHWEESEYYLREKQGKNKPSLRERYDKIKDSEWFKKTHEGMSISDDEKVDDANYCSDCINKKGCINCVNGDMKETEHKIKPKFHEGDWITCEELNTALIVNIVDDKYEVEFVDGNKGFPHIDYIDRLFHLWTIKDAKDGDVLASKDKLSILIFKNLDTSISFSSYYNIAGQGELGWSNDCFVPATKEQRDLLFQKMHESDYNGYDWYNHALMKV